MHSIWQTAAASAASLYHRGCKMGWCFIKRKNKERNCSHEWEITQNLHITRQHDTPAYVVPESKQTNVYRICCKCLKKETHVVEGHIDHSKAYKIFGGKDE